MTYFDPQKTKAIHELNDSRKFTTNLLLLRLITGKYLGFKVQPQNERHRCIAPVWTGSGVTVRELNVGSKRLTVACTHERNTTLFLIKPSTENIEVSVLECNYVPIHNKMVYTLRLNCKS